MSNESLLKQGIQLLIDLNIRHLLRFKDHLEMSYEFNNQKVIAYGKTEEELIENFYQLYQELFNPA